MTPALLFAAGLFLAWSNGANDNFKGVATLLGSRTLGARAALLWGTVTTLAGSLLAVALSGELARAFSGRGIVPDALVGEPALLLATGTGAAIVVMAATVLRLPVSTTHALVGGLAGAGWAAAGSGALEWGTLGMAFAVPLALSPFVAAAGVGLLYPVMKRLRTRTDLGETDMLELRRSVGGSVGDEAALLMAKTATDRRLAEGRSAAIALDPVRTVFGVQARRLLDGLHMLSGGAVSFARGLNDTPKIAALLMATGVTGTAAAMACVGAGMAAGALLQALRVGRTMSEEITPMNAGQGFTANVVTAALVLGASRFGLPVSTTHVSVGSLFGLGASTGGLVRKTCRRILLAWVATLPLAFGLAYGVRVLVG